LALILLALILLALILLDLPATDAAWRQSGIAGQHGSLRHIPNMQRVAGRLPMGCETSTDHRLVRWTLDKLSPRVAG